MVRSLMRAMAVYKCGLCSESEAICGQISIGGRLIRKWKIVALDGHSKRFHCYE